MIAYGVLNLVIIILGTIKSKKRLGIFALNIILLILILFSGLRGDFTTDYNNYIKIYDEISCISFGEIIKTKFSQEIGFVLLTKIISAVFNSKIAYMFIISALISILFYVPIKKHSDMPWLSLYLFVTIGSFYVSFNIMRQILSVAITFYASDYLFKRKFLKYSISILIAALFHVSALIMILFYYILNFKVSKKNLILIVIFSVIIFLSLHRLIAIIQKLIPKYSYSYGMFEGGTINNLLLPVFIILIIAVSLLAMTKEQKKIFLNNSSNRIMINSIVYYSVFSILMLKTYMLVRFTYFFQPYVLLLIPNLLKYHNSDDKKYLLAIIVLLCFLYPLVTLSGTAYNPFYFIWQR